MRYIPKYPRAQQALDWFFAVVYIVGGLVLAASAPNHPFPESFGLIIAGTLLCFVGLYGNPYPYLPRDEEA